MELIVILTIFHNVIFQMDIIAQPLMESNWLMLLIVFRLIMKHATKIKEAFATLQEIHLLGVIF